MDNRSNHVMFSAESNQSKTGSNSYTTLAAKILNNIAKMVRYLIFLKKNREQIYDIVGIFI